VVRGRKNPLHKKLPERLRRVRRDAELSASALSLAAGISKGGAAKLEAGTWVPRLPTVERLALALRLSPAWLAFGMEAAWDLTDYVGCSGLAVRVRDARTLRGFSIREVERRAKTAEGSIRAVEAGTMPSLDTLEQIAKALGVSPAWLAFGQGAMELPARRRASREDRAQASNP
jgi:transcriptional regulator with XRE-family HTH domain